MLSSSLPESIVEETNELRRNHERRQRAKQDRMKNLFRDALGADVARRELRDADSARVARNATGRRIQRKLTRTLGNRGRSGQSSSRRPATASYSTSFSYVGTASNNGAWRRTGQYFRAHGVPPSPKRPVRPTSPGLGSMQPRRGWAHGGDTRENIFGHF